MYLPSSDRLVHAELLLTEGKGLVYIFKSSITVTQQIEYR